MKGTEKGLWKTVTLTPRLTSRKTLSGVILSEGRMVMPSKEQLFKMVKEKAIKEEYVVRIIRNTIQDLIEHEIREMVRELFEIHLRSNIREHLEKNLTQESIYEFYQETIDRIAAPGILVAAAGLEIPKKGAIDGGEGQRNPENGAI